MIVILPVSLYADDTGAAMLRSNAGVLLNKNPAPASSALFPDDLVETAKNSGARIEATGSTAEINPDTVVQFEGNELNLEHGSLSVNTSRGMKVRVGCLTVTPVNPSVGFIPVVFKLSAATSISLLPEDRRSAQRRRQTAAPIRVRRHEMGPQVLCTMHK